LKAGLARRRAEGGACQDVIGLQGGIFFEGRSSLRQPQCGSSEAHCHRDTAAVGERPAMPATFAPRRVAVDLHAGKALNTPPHTPASPLASAGGIP